MTLVKQHRFDRLQKLVKQAETHHFDPALVSKPARDFQAHSGKPAIQQLLDERTLQPGGDIEAIVTASDDIARGGLDELTARGAILLT
ncbi:MAG: hypothetical protein GY801_26060 [bacterium]|nr:hypothetical protein [bacterium]